MSDQDGSQVFTIRPSKNDEKEAWKAYWKAKNQPWRTEPEIETGRQKELAQRLSPELDILGSPYFILT